MNKPVRVILLDEAESEYKKLNEIAGQQIKEGKDNTEEMQLLRSIKQKIEFIKSNPFYGGNIAKSLIPKEYIIKYNAKNLWRVELTNYWGMLYTIKGGAKQETGLLKSFEGKDFSKGGIPISHYSFFNMAVDYLMKDKPIKALDDFCVNLADGKGMSMPKAFEAAFGIPLEKLYDDFESYRKTW